MNKVFILGGEQSDFQRNWSKEGKSFLAMMKEVVDDALFRVGIDYKEIARLNKKNKIGVFVGNFDAQQFTNQGHLGAFFTEIHQSFIGIPGARYEAACASGAVAIDAARTKIQCREIDIAIVLGIEIMKTVSPETGGDFLGTASYYKLESKGNLFPFPRLFSNLANVILERYTLKESRFMHALSEISRINYANAKKNPKAQTRSWFMDKEHVHDRGGEYNKEIGGRLCIADCSQITDGAAVVILASKNYTEEYARKKKVKLKKIPYMKGWGYRIAPVRFSQKMEESLHSEFILPWTRQAVLDAYDRASLTAEDIDVFETHDCFTSSEYLSISAFGMTKPGREFEAIEEGTIEIGGGKPINPSGGLIGIGHPVGATGVRMMLDLYKQVTGNAQEYQVEGAKNALMLNFGGSATTNVVFIIGR